MFWNIADLQTRLMQSIQRSQAILRHGRENARKIGSHFERRFQEMSRQRDVEIDRLDMPLRAGWSDQRWESWTPGTLVTQPLLRIGRLDENRRSTQSWSLPAFAPFLGQGQTIVIRTPPELADAGRSLLQSLVMRTVLMVPYGARYTLVDPAGAGAAFPMRRQLAPYVRENTSHVDRDLREVNDDIRRTIETYLDATSDSFEKLTPEMRATVRYQFVFAADFPHEYDREAITEMISIGNKGPRAGVYLFIHHNTGYPAPRDLSLDLLKSAAIIDLTGAASTPFPGYTLNADAAPTPEVQRRLFDTLARSRPPEPVIDWDKMVGLTAGALWRENAITRIEAPVGARGGSGVFNLYFGVDPEGRPCSHGLLAAMTGAGKSSLYHSFIMSLAVRYSPQELRLYLIDGKNGVEFQPYRHLPHAEVVALQTQPELARAVLEELLTEMVRRNEMFQRLKVADFQGYRQLKQGPLPRILLVVDEYQELFEGDFEGRASDALLKLSGMGRSAGIHLLLGSQKFSATGMEHREAILDNFHLRIGMQMQRDAIEALTEFGRRGKNLLLSCDSPGKVVVNERGGDDSNNVFGKVAYLKPERRDRLLEGLTAQAARMKPEHLPRRAVFNGRRQPSLLENTQLTALLERSTWLKSQELEALARVRPDQGGLGLEHWYAAEQPRVGWLGQMFTVRGQARLVLKRGTAENAIIVGDNNSARYGMLASVVVSMALNLGPAGTEFTLLDRSTTGSQWSTVLSQTVDSLLLPAGFRCRLSRQASDLEPLCAELIEELQRRRQMREEDCARQPTRIVLLTEADTIEHVRRVPGQFGMGDGPGSKALSRLLAEGPSAGIHVILSFARLSQVRQVLDPRSQLPLVSHRVALQMAEVDSHDLIGDRSATRLQADSPTPICAVYRDFQAGTPAVRFKPYSTESQGEDPADSLLGQIGLIADRLKKR